SREGGAPGVLRGRGPRPAAGQDGGGRKEDREDDRQEGGRQGDRRGRQPGQAGVPEGGAKGGRGRRGVPQKVRDGEHDAEQQSGNPQRSDQGQAKTIGGNLHADHAPTAQVPVTSPPAPWPTPRPPPS